ncbi:hypothetical protein PVL29_001599 [Vitis rotundifolia]|uniref:BZIP domain-containing protein n=1 Tax=Vitis rotundifolia TaxID=103349 RepID=A0AA39AEL0_VITRO|nr:hypothetical protein PVL29_001599 [Vitis rotundifolia]
MGKSEAEMSSKSDKVSSSAEEQTNIHLLYPDWASIQACYGSGVPLLAPHFNSAVPGSHFPYPYVWAPSQPLIPPYGVPYTAIYSHGGVHAHPVVPLVATPLSKKVPSRSSVDMDQGVRKKLKRLDELAVPVGNGSTEDDAGGSVYEVSQSAKHSIDGSTDGSDGNTGAFLPQRNSGSEGILSTDNDGIFHRFAGSLSEGEAYAASHKVSVNSVAPTNVAGKSVRPLNRSEEIHAACVASSTSAGSPFEVCQQDERQLKRERRKQANRESAKRSRLRKQEKLKNKQQLELQGEMAPYKIEADLILTDSPEEVYKLNDSNSLNQNVQMECGIEENLNSETKLHQLLKSNSRTDAIVAG